MTGRMGNGLRATALALALALGIVGGTGVGSLSPTHVAAQEADVADTEDDDGDSGRWGLLGLLGLAGLAGLLKRPERTVVRDDTRR